MNRILALTAATAAILAGSAAQAATIGNVFYIAMENHNWTQPAVMPAGFTSLHQILGNSAAPFINSLVTPGSANAALVSYASNYQNVAPSIHPSEPNYVWQESGTNGPLNDNNPYPNNIVNAANLSGDLQAKGISWKSYQEDTDLLNTNGQNFDAAGGVLTNNVAALNQYEVPLKSFSGTSASYTNAHNGSHQYDFAAKHDGQLYFTDTNGGNDPTSSNPEASHYAPLQALATDLANNTVAKYNWITPDQFNDMHSKLNTNFTYNGVTYAPGDQQEIAMGDNFLSQIVPLIEASAAFQNNGEIVIWNDETEGDAAAGTNGFSSMEIVISPLAKGNAYTNSIYYNHSNDLATLQAIFGDSTPLGAAAGAYTMSDLYQAGVVPEPGTWAMLLLGVGGIGLTLRRQTRTAVLA